VGMGKLKMVYPLISYRYINLVGMGKFILKKDLFLGVPIISLRNILITKQHKMINGMLIPYGETGLLLLQKSSWP